MSIEGQGHFFTIYFPGFVCFVLYKATIYQVSVLQDHWSSGFKYMYQLDGSVLLLGLLVIFSFCLFNFEYFLMQTVETLIRRPLIFV